MMTATLTQPSIFSPEKRYYSVEEAFDRIDDILINAFGDEAKSFVNANRQQQGWPLR
jgi:hypothetical protein